MNLTYYEVLEVPSTASSDDIKKAYKRLAMTHHPDRGGNTEKFQQINQAYEVLSDTKERNKYDRDQVRSRAASAHAHTSSSQSRQPDIANFVFNIFSNMMNIQMNRPKTKLGDDTLKLSISVKDALVGTTVAIKKDLEVRCTECLKTCEQCKGQGYLIVKQQQGGLITNIQQECSKCQKTGFVYTLEPERKCPCVYGFKKQTHELLLNLPPSKCIDSTVKFEGYGQQPKEFLHVPGDFFVYVSVDVMDKNISINKSNGSVTYSPTISVRDMMCGCTISLPTEFTHDKQTNKVSIPPMSLNPSFCITIEHCGLTIDDEHLMRSQMYVRPKVLYDVDATQVNVEKLKEAFLT